MIQRAGKDRERDREIEKEHAPALCGHWNTLDLLKRDYFRANGYRNYFCLVRHAYQIRGFCIRGWVGDISKARITRSKQRHNHLVVSAQSEKVGSTFALVTLGFHVEI